MDSKDTKNDDKAGEDVAAKKHKTLNDEKADEVQQVEQVKGKHVIETPFIHPAKSWDNSDDFNIPKDIQANIVDVCKFEKPSVIQGVSIPMITAEPYHSLIAQAKNGSGKTGSFSIGTTLRVDRDLKAI